jgi:hypothetical protein
MKLMAVVLIMLLIAAIPLAFALTSMNHPKAAVPTASVYPIRDSSTLDPFASLLPPNVTDCKGFGFSCVKNPVRQLQRSWFF